MPQKKRRLPIEQLRAAGRIAKQMLIDRRILAKNSIIDEILHSKDAPALPGVPAYLPQHWTIKAAQRIFRDILIMWMAKHKDDGERLDNITEFYKFMIGKLREEQSQINKEITGMPALMRKMKDVPVLKDIFAPMQKKETVKSIQHFFIDSFAVGVMLENDKPVTTTSEFANWFITWTQELDALWIKPEKRQNIEKV